jgi:hypothetical protein
VKFRPSSLFLLLVIAIFGQGCLVWRYPTTPQVSGSVIDATTKQPIANATVGIRQHSRTVRTTAKDGSFLLRSDHIWRPCPLIPGDYWPQGLLFIEAASYRTVERKVATFGGRLVILEQPIELERKTR